jgi:hypothetical protein
MCKTLLHMQQKFVMGAGGEWMGRNRVAVGNVCWMVTREPNNPKESTVAAPLLQKHILFVPG